MCQLILINKMVSKAKSTAMAGDQALGKPLIQKRPEVALSAFSFLFSEIVQQIMKTEKAAQA